MKRIEVTCHTPVEELSRIQWAYELYTPQDELLDFEGTIHELIHFLQLYGKVICKVPFTVGAAIPYLKINQLPIGSVFSSSEGVYVVGAQGVMFFNLLGVPSLLIDPQFSSNLEYKLVHLP